MKKNIMYVGMAIFIMFGASLAQQNAKLINEFGANTMHFLQEANTTGDLYVKTSNEGQYCRTLAAISYNEAASGNAEFRFAYPTENVITVALKIPNTYTIEKLETALDFDKYRFITRESDGQATVMSFLHVVKNTQYPVVFVFLVTPNPVSTTTHSMLGCLFWFMPIR